MQNLEEDLREECIEQPQKIKKSIYMPKSLKCKPNTIRTKKGRCYDMNEKFQYVLDRIDSERREEFKNQRRQQRLIKLFNDYHTLNFPITSIEAGHIGKANGRNMRRVLNLLKISNLIVETTQEGDKYRTYDKISTSSEKVLEILIDSREAMTDWERSKKKECITANEALKSIKPERHEKEKEEKDKELSNSEVEEMLKRFRAKIEEMFHDLSEKFIAMRAVFPKMEFDSFYEFFLRCYSEEESNCGS